MIFLEFGEVIFLGIRCKTNRTRRSSGTSSQATVMGPKTTAFSCPPFWLEAMHVSAPYLHFLIGKNEHDNKLDLVTNVPAKNILYRYTNKCLSCKTAPPLNQPLPQTFSLLHCRLDSTSPGEVCGNYLYSCCPTNFVETSIYARQY